MRRPIIIAAAPLVPNRVAVIERMQRLDQDFAGDAVNAEREESGTNVDERHHARIFLWPIEHEHMCSGACSRKIARSPSCPASVSRSRPATICVSPIALL